MYSGQHQNNHATSSTTIATTIATASMYSLTSITGDAHSCPSGVHLGSAANLALKTALKKCWTKLSLHAHIITYIHGTVRVLGTYDIWHDEVRRMACFGAVSIASTCSLCGMAMGLHMNRSLHRQGDCLQKGEKGTSQTRNSWLKEEISRLSVATLPSVVPVPYLYL